MIKKILFPVDSSEACAAMAPYVLRAAELFSAQVSLLHVCHPESNNGFELYVRPLQEIAEEHIRIAQESLDSMLSSELPADLYPRLLRCGDAAEQILEEARSGEYDLILMPTHAGRLRRMLLGSTTARVLSDAECPVLTVQYDHITAPRAVQNPTWICALSLSEDSQRVLRAASRAAVQGHAELFIVHVAGEDDSDTVGAEELRRLDELVEAVGCKATVHITRGAVKDAILASAANSAADVIITGRTAASHALARMPHLLFELVRDSPIPVLSV